MEGPIMTSNAIQLLSKIKEGWSSIVWKVNARNSQLVCEGTDIASKEVVSQAPRHFQSEVGNVVSLETNLLANQNVKERGKDFGIGEPYGCLKYPESFEVLLL